MEGSLQITRESARLRMSYDLRNSDQDQRQRMLNAIEPGSVVSIHRHSATSAFGIYIWPSRLLLRGLDFCGWVGDFGLLLSAIHSYNQNDA